MDDLEKNLKLLELATIEQQKYIDGHQSRINFYSGLISTIIAATFAGFFNSKEDFHYYALIIGPILVYVISLFGIKGTYRIYQGIIEAITKVAKLEQELGLINESDKSNKKYWKTEPIVPSRHLRDRMESMSSEEFVKNSFNKGYYLWTKYLFYSFQIISIIMIIGLILTAVFQ
ncbi:MAG: hypothetical protein SCALA702_00640 [Melioribacteraceae bacterium]|nr:MAG: hypothetical protein SCALA702_00640 [Melioribacteraceae bacterium]